MYILITYHRPKYRIIKCDACDAAQAPTFHNFYRCKSFPSLAPFLLLFPVSSPYLSTPGNGPFWDVCGSDDAVPVVWAYLQMKCIFMHFQHRQISVAC